MEWVKVAQVVSFLPESANWKGKDCARSTLGPVLQSDLALVQRDNSMRQGETEARSVAVGGDKRLEEPLSHFQRKPRSSILDPHLDPIVGSSQVHPDRTCPTGLAFGSGGIV